MREREREMVIRRVKVVEGDGLKMGGFLGGRRLSSIIWGRGKIVRTEKEREGIFMDSFHHVGIVASLSRDGIGTELGPPPHPPAPAPAPARPSFTPSRPFLGN